MIFNVFIQDYDDVLDYLLTITNHFLIYWLHETYFVVRLILRSMVDNLITMEENMTLVYIYKYNIIDLITERTNQSYPNSDYMPTDHTIQEF